MNISLFDILAKLIPGGLLFFFIIHSAPNVKIESNQVVGLIIIYVLGYFIEAISSHLERPLIFRLFGGNPAVKLLNGQGYNSIKISRIERLNEIITTKFEQYSDNKLKLFRIFHSIVSKKGYKRVNTFSEQYFLSRNLFVSSFISGILFLIFHFGWIELILFIIILLLAFFRTKQRNYYFVKEVINSYIHEEDIDVKKQNTPEK